MNAPLSPVARQALRSLEDCKVIRTRFDHEGMFELLEMRRVTFAPVAGDENAADWRLA